MITGSLACGCAFEVDDDATGPPTCLKHHTDRVTRVTAPPPRITGAGRGPLVETRDLPPVARRLAPPLVLQGE